MVSVIIAVFRGKGKRLVLITPGRIGTSSPALGVPSSFADISEFNAIIEVSESEAGYMPELSYGSHFFQDLVEAGILYTAVFRDGTTLAFSPEAILGAGRSFAEYSADDRLRGIFHVMETSDSGIMIWSPILTGAPTTVLEVSTGSLWLKRSTYRPSAV